MELKSHDDGSIDVSNSVLIVPLWNWNKAERLIHDMKNEF